MSAAPDTGRTAEEMRETIARTGFNAWYGRPEYDEHPVQGMWERVADALIAGPLANLIAENESLRSRLLQAEKGAEAMRWSTDWAAAARHKGDIIAGAYSSQGCWRQAVVGYAAGIFWDWPFGEKPTHWRHLDKPPALNPNQEAGAWPSGCIKPNSCSRHRQCMYAGSVEQCRHFGKDLTADVEAALAAKAAPLPETQAKTGGPS